MRGVMVVVVILASVHHAVILRLQSLKSASALVAHADRVDAVIEFAVIVHDADAQGIPTASQALGADVRPMLDHGRVHGNTPLPLSRFEDEVDHALVRVGLPFEFRWGHLRDVLPRVEFRDVTPCVERV